MWGRTPMTATGAVSLRDGARIDLATGETFVADATEPDGDIVTLSHAHGDHLYVHAPTSVICSDLTARLTVARREDEGSLSRTSHPAIEQVPAGHIPGSRATIIEDNDGTTYLYTGDVSTRNRFTLDGFDAETVTAEYDIDVLVTETTYGKPEYMFAEQDTLETRIVDWLDDTDDTPVVLFGYTLGRAQELELLVDRSERNRLFMTEATERLNEVIGPAHGVDFAAERYDREVTIGAGDALVLPA